MILLNDSQTNMISGAGECYNGREPTQEIIEMQFIATVPYHCPMAVEVYTCPVAFLWYCAEQNFGGLCGLAGGGLSTEPDGSVTCTVY